MYTLSNKLASRYTLDYTILHIQKILTSFRLVKTWRNSIMGATLFIVVNNTRVKTQPVQGWWKQPWTMLCCLHCSMLSTILFSVVTPDCRLIQAQQRWTILLTTLNNVGSTTLFKAAFNSSEQVVRFCCVLFSIATPNQAQQYCWQLWTMFTIQHCFILFQ